MLRRFLIRWGVNFVGLWVAALLLGGISYGEKLRVLLIAALIFSIVNTVIRPILIILTLPAIVLSLGLFTLVINTFMLYLVTVLYPKFHVGSFWTGVVAVIIIWIVNYIMNNLLEPAKHEQFGHQT
jgi:putative membrane protein